MIDFPASPINGQVFVSGAQSWTFDGTKWVASGNAVMPPLATGDNRVINGDMRIDQRNNGASGTAVNTYTVDRWRFVAAQTAKFSWQRVGGPVQFGFPYALGLSSSSAYTPVATDYFQVYQPIEADTVSDFAWGTANAQPVTLSFVALCTLAGTFSGSLQNTAGTRSYPFTFTLPTNTWTKVSVTIPGDTAGAWVASGNAGSMYVTFDLGSGANYRGPANAWASAGYSGANGTVQVVATNGASFQVTGVKLEIGSIATPFNRQSLAKSLADCQRYFYQWSPSNSNSSLGSGQAYSASQAGGFYPFPITMRAAPTCNMTAGAIVAITAGGGTTGAFTGGTLSGNANAILSSLSGSSGLVAGNGTTFQVVAGGVVTASAEL